MVDLSNYFNTLSFYKLYQVINKIDSKENTKSKIICRQGNT